eukprot:scaffold29673_cov23-Tisochrysis_lutea.AAC.2
MGSVCTAGVLYTPEAPERRGAPERQDDPYPLGANGKQVSVWVTWHIVEVSGSHGNLSLKPGAHMACYLLPRKLRTPAHKESTKSTA